MYEGAYNLANVSAASPLLFYAPGTFYMCGSGTFANSFTFRLLQNLTANFDLAGYYTPGETGAAGGGETFGVLHPYSPGIYTVIAGDPLGNTKVMHFRVTGTTGIQERTGPVSTFPASWLNPCNESARGNISTGVYLDLNASSALDHININQVFAQIVNSSSFQYLAVGHGWVVSEWVESEASGVDLVIVTFIVTNDGVPSSYLYAYYNPAGGTVYATSSAIQTVTCIS